MKSEYKEFEIDYNDDKEMDLIYHVLYLITMNSFEDSGVVWDFDNKNKKIYVSLYRYI